MQKRMTLVIDRDRCEGHGQCAFVAPHLVHLDDAGAVVIDMEDVTDHIEAAQKAEKKLVLRLLCGSSRISGSSFGKHAP
jgi:ferredoxin